MLHPLLANLLEGPAGQFSASTKKARLLLQRLKNQLVLDFLQVALEGTRNKSGPGKPGVLLQTNLCQSLTPSQITRDLMLPQCNRCLVSITVSASDLTPNFQSADTVHALAVKPNDDPSGLQADVGSWIDLLCDLDERSLTFDEVQHLFHFPARLLIQMWLLSAPGFGPPFALRCCVFSAMKLIWSSCAVLEQP